MEEKIRKIIYFEFNKQNGFEIPAYDESSAVRINEASQKAVVELKSKETVEINLPFLYSNTAGLKHLSFNISKSKLESYNFSNQQNTIKTQENEIEESNSFLDNLKKQKEAESIDKEKRNYRIKVIVLVILIVTATVLAIVFDIQI
jgi:hypothetical protein